MHQDRVLAVSRPVLTSRMLTIFAIACGAVVANLYYAQPMLHAMAGTLGVSFAAVGLLVTLGQLGYAVGLVFIVPLGDMVDRRRLVAAVLAVSVLALVAARLSPTFLELGASLLLVGLSSVAAQILIPFTAFLAAPESRGRAVGTVMTGLLLGILLARTASGLVAGALGWRAVYLAAAALILLVLILLAREMPQVAPRPQVRYGALLGSVLTLVRREPVLRYRAWLGLLNFAAFNVLWTTLAFRLSGPPYHYTVTVIGLFGLAGVAGALAAGRAGRWADAGREKWTTRAFAAALTAAYALLWWGRGTVWLLIAGIMVLDVGVQGLQITNQTEIYRLDEEARSRITTVYMTASFLGGAAGSGVAALVYQSHGWLGVSLLGGALGLAATGTAWVGNRRVPSTASAAQRPPLG